MKKQIKQKENTDAKQNSNANSNENRTPVSEETKQKLVQQYRDRADASSNQNDINPPEWNGEWNYSHSGMVHPWESYNLPKNGMDVDGFVSEKNINPRYNDTQSGYLGEALNANPWEMQQPELDTSGLPREKISMDQLNNIVNAMSNDAMAERADTNLKPNMLYGYGDVPLDALSRYELPIDRPEGYRTVYDYLEDEGLEDWANDTDVINGPSNQRALSTAFNLMQNANDYYRQQELDQWAKNYRDQQLYGDALAELAARQQTQNNSRSLVRDAIQQTRHQQHMDDLARGARRRNITDSAVW